MPRILAILSVVLMALPLPSAAAGRFDGTWNVIVHCEPAPDRTLAYTYRFVATVKEGVLHGEHGVKETAGWLTLDGPIKPDGSATLEARGLTGDPNYAIGHVRQLTGYGYHVAAHFEGSQGSGERVEDRACTVGFQKR
jgi:hypothetical protein